MKTLVRWECEKHSHMMLSVIKMWVIWSWITRARQWGSRGDDPIRALSRGRWLLRSFSHFPFFLKSKMLYGHDSWLRLKFTTSLQKGFFWKWKGKSHLEPELFKKSGRSLLSSIGGSSRARSLGRYDAIHMRQTDLHVLWLCVQNAAASQPILPLFGSFIITTYFILKYCR